MRMVIPVNNVIYDYDNILNNFISSLQNKQGDNIKCIYLSGSYARGEANDSSDLDIYCVFNRIDFSVLKDVGYAVQNTPVPYETLEINPQCLSIDEFNDITYNSWSEKSLKNLDSVLLYGEDIFENSISKTELQKIYKVYLVDILMGIRHYICVDEPKEKLTYEKIKKWILKPLMFPLRIERYCSLGEYPLTICELEELLENDEKQIVKLLKSESFYNDSIQKDHKEVLNYLHNIVLKKISS